MGRNTVHELADVVRIECSDDALGARRPLTEAERDIAWRMAAGMRDREIADAMRTAVRTVNAHARSVLSKCGVSSRAELASRVATALARAAREDAGCSRADPVALVEAAYETIEASNAVWLRALAEAMSGLGSGYGAMAGLFDVSDPARIRMEVAASSSSPPTAVDAVRDAYAKLPPAVRIAMCSFGAGFAAERFGQPDLARIPGGTHMTDIGIAGGFGVVGVDASACGVTVSVPMTAARLRTMQSLPVRAWRRAASHLATAVRLRARRALASREPDAVLLPNGFVVHATGDAKPAVPRGALGAAAKRMDRARTRAGRADPERALELWQALVSGRWSLVDTIESDGKRILVAHRNETPGVTSPALTSRESQVAALVAGGRSNKEIAYELGIGLSTVETLVLRARRKLGAPTRAALAGLVPAR